MSADSLPPGALGHAPSGPRETPALSVSDVSKTFEGTTVLTRASLEVRPGEVHALVGENGSGKSTLVKILAGLYHADPGAAFSVAGHSLDPAHAGASASAGLRFVHQDLGLVANLDTRDNLAFVEGYDRRWPRAINWRRETTNAKASLQRLGYDFDVTRPVQDLTISERTAVAIVRALSSDQGEARVVVLDEPTANLTESEADQLFGSIRRLRDAGIGVLFISHHFEEVFSLSDRVTVLRDGRVIATRETGSLTKNDLVELMIGRRLDPVDSIPRGLKEAEEILVVDGLVGSVVDDVRFTVSSGEVVGVAGITGSGREELARLVVGDLTRVAGDVSVAGKAVSSGRPDRAKALGVAYVPAERKSNAVVNGRTVGENLTVADVPSLSRRGFLSGRQEQRETETWLTRLDVRPRRGDYAIESLSGGNQQKVMLARSLRLAPSVLVLDEPTQGVDVGAQAQIRQHIHGAVVDGLGVLVCSSSSEELAEMCHRVLVLAGGRIVEELKAPMSVDQITAATLRSSHSEDV